MLHPAKRHSLLLNQLKAVLKKTWLFPVIVFSLVVTLTACNINGSSIGVYHDFLYGTESKDPNLLVGNPQTIRSDEWLVNTQLTIAQAANDFKRINSNFPENKDMSVVIDVPYYDWSTLFKPQNFSFFILPLEYAFAFKWWIILGILLISVYYFSLRILPGKIGIAVAISLTFSLSPFIFWWYQTSTIMTLAYAFLMLLTSMSIIDKNRLSIFKKKLGNKASQAIKIAALAYLLTAFAFILYPPFQIPVALVVTFFVVGYLLKKLYGKPMKTSLLTLLPFGIAVLITGALCGTYVINRLDTIHTISNTAYPGKRTVTSGDYDIKKLLVNYLQPQLQDEKKGGKYLLNQSESSSFTVLPLFFLIPAIVLVGWIYKKKKKIEWLLLSIITCCLLFLAFLFIPGINTLTTLLLLHLVPHERLLIGLGFASIIMVVYMIRLLDRYRPVTKKVFWTIIAYSTLFLSIAVWAGVETSHAYPEFVTSKKIIIALAILLTTGMACILLNRPRIGLGILVLFSLFSVYNIHPLYRGLGPAYHNEISATIQSVSPPSATWGAAQHIYLENFPQMSGRPAVTGVSGYPDIRFWDSFAGANNNTTFNRYAHTILSSSDQGAITLIAPDFFTISSACERKISERIEYIVSTEPLKGTCETLIKKLKYPMITFYFYRQ